MEHHELFEDTWEQEKKNVCRMLMMMSYQLLSLMLDIQRIWKN